MERTRWREWEENVSSRQSGQWSFKNSSTYRWTHTTRLTPAIHHTGPSNFSPPHRYSPPVTRPCPARTPWRYPPSPPAHWHSHSPGPFRGKYCRPTRLAGLADSAGTPAWNSHPASGYPQCPGPDLRRSGSRWWANSAVHMTPRPSRRDSRRLRRRLWRWPRSRRRRCTGTSRFAWGTGTGCSDRRFRLRRFGSRSRRRTATKAECTGPRGIWSGIGWCRSCSPPRKKFHNGKMELLSRKMLILTSTPNRWIFFEQFF